MDANIRELKAGLSGVIRKVQRGEIVTVRVRNRAVARIVPIAEGKGEAQLRQTPGIAWKGGKPAGLRHGERVPRGVALAGWVAEDQR
jgi:prevent-host-death family protein